MRKGRVTSRSVRIGVVALVVLSVGTAACSSTSDHLTAPPPPTTEAASSNSAGTALGGTSAALALQRAYVAVVNKIRPSVVEVSTRTDLGSGIVFDTKGDIVTNNHVVNGATAFTVTAPDGHTYPGTLVGVFAPDDLAVIRVQGAPSLVPATFADSSELEVGQITLAVGNPLGLQSSVTSGIVSAVGRTVSEGSNGVILPDTVQTSASINPGNSGGALVDLNGQVIGIPTLAATSAQFGGGAAPGIGFAIASNTVKLIATQLASSGKVTKSGRAALGVGVATGFNQAGQPAGVIVRQVLAGQGAEKAGIKVGDVITAVNGNQVTNISELTDALAGLSPGQTVKISIQDPSGAQRTLNVTLGQLSGG